MAILGAQLEAALATVGLNLVTRAEWGARPREYLNQIQLPTPRLWIHHTADDRQGASAVRAHQNYHMDTKGWSDIAYSLLVGDWGEVYEGRGIGVQGGHTANENRVSHAICLLGNFSGRRPTAASLDTVVKLARLGRDRRWWVPTLGGHRDAPGASTSCPGDHLYAQLPSLRILVAQAPVPPVEEDEDVAYYTYVTAPGKPPRIAVDGGVVGFPNVTELYEFLNALNAAGYKRHNLRFAEADDWDRYMNGLTR